MIQTLQKTYKTVTGCFNKHSTEIEIFQTRFETVSRYNTLFCETSWIRINDMVFQQKSTAECRVTMATFESALEANVSAKSPINIDHLQP